MCTKKPGRHRLFAAGFLLIIWTAVVAFGQNASGPVKQNARDGSSGKGETSAAAASATGTSSSSAADNYSYEFTQPEFYVRRVLVEHDARGRGRITFERKNQDQALTEPVELSGEALARIAAHWETLRYLEGGDAYQSSKQFPHLGTVRLKVRRAGDAAERAAEFNWTDVRSASALAEEYRRVGEQAMFIFDIKLARDLQPLEAPKIMDRLDILISRNGISDARQLLPLLEDLATDERIPLIARNHAERLAKKIKKSK